MSVYIRGMEMPSNCRDCPLEDAYEGYNCRIVEKSANWGLEGRPSWCPLVPAPEHGRLIEEADAIETTLMILRGLGYLKEENPQLEQTVREVFATAPAIEVEEHG